MDTLHELRDQPETTEYDLVVVGGGASGLTAAMFAARYGLDTLVFDSGSSAIRRSYSIENYLGFLAVKPETFLRLGRAHARYEGVELVDDLVTVIEERDGRFRVRTENNTSVNASSILAASAYNADYLTGLNNGTFHNKGEHPVDCDEATGRTCVDGLYVAGWLSGQPHQVLIAAGHGARVAKSVIRDRRLEQGYWEGIADYWDWSVEVGTYGDETWHDRIDEWIDSTLPEDHAISDERIERVREAVKEERLAFECSPAEREARMEDTRQLRKVLFETEERAPRTS
ncbi:thioredoxin reductase [Natrialba chahannaoensis JCM 10990]|uniref:Thioredoxin reductase n=1 Tax=Natrialba chahannaoensis JCM 10990 TaxID=1227492 RepID=M0AFJ1_9EURY|nr:NAD(P)/FAD-dependent oxidoreductase [Natrialba chahannaoensis]ELY96108.1 thioredoxin reductase [Natrialba chahannaoensis JCM 10990]